jgi:hypothetical protein
MSNRKLLVKIKRDPIGVQWYSDNSIFAYHRSRSVTDIHNIAYDKFKPTKRNITAIYGPAVYGTYDLRSQQSPYMKKNYGDYILRMVVDLSNFLVFDKAFQDKLNKPTIREQIQLVGDSKRANMYYYRRNTTFCRKIIDLHEARILDRSNPNIKYYTSEYAKAMWDMIGSELPNKFSGMLFTGKNDGHIIVCYNMEAIHFLDYARYVGSALKTGKQPHWEQWPVKVEEESQHFAEQLMTRLGQINNFKTQRQTFVREVVKLRKVQREYMLAWLFTWTPPANVGELAEWLLNPDSDQTFARLFPIDDNILKINSFDKCLENMHYKVGRPTHHFRYYAASGAIKTLLTQNDDYTVFGNNLVGKIVDFHFRRFNIIWKAKLAEYIISGNRLKLRGISQFVHRASLLIELWHDINEGWFNGKLSVVERWKFLREITLQSHHKKRFSIVNLR